MSHNYLEPPLFIFYIKQVSCRLPRIGVAGLLFYSDLMKLIPDWMSASDIPRWRASWISCCRWLSLSVIANWRNWLGSMRGVCVVGAKPKFCCIGIGGIIVWNGLEKPIEFSSVVDYLIEFLFKGSEPRFYGVGLGCLGFAILFWKRRNSVRHNYWLDRKSVV